jgi:hypothetical protein
MAFLKIVYFTRSLAEEQRRAREQASFIFIPAICHLLKLYEVTFICNCKGLPLPWCQLGANTYVVKKQLKYLLVSA